MSVASSQNSSEMNFKEDETVLCFHGPLLYEAKVVKAENWKPGDSETGDTGPHYYVHYKGWKASYDEWVPNERLVKHTKENLERQAQLKVQHAKPKKRSVPAKTIVQKTVVPTKDETLIKKKTAIIKAAPSSSKSASINKAPAQKSTILKSSATKSTPSIINNMIEYSPSSPHEKAEIYKKRRGKKLSLTTEESGNNTLVDDVMDMDQKINDSIGDEDDTNELDIDFISVKNNNSIDQGPKATDITDEEVKDILESIEEPQPGTHDHNFIKEDRGRKRKFLDSEDNQENPSMERFANYMNRAEISIPIPDPLQVKLIDDWENIMRLGQVMQMPRSSPTVRQILTRWSDYQRKDDLRDDTSVGNTFDPPSLILSIDSKTPKKDAEKHQTEGKLEKEGQKNVESTRSALEVDTAAEDGSDFKVNAGSQIISAPNSEAEFIRPENVGTDINLDNSQMTNGKLSEEPMVEKEKDVYGMVVDGLLRYFDKCLTNALLYQPEKTSLAEYRNLNNDLSYADIYGAEHLLRFFVLLPNFLSKTDIDEESAIELQLRCIQILTFLLTHVDEFFSTTYIPSSEPSMKRQKTGRRPTASWKNQEGLVCANCGTSETPGWRIGSTQDEKLCNACGLYYAKNKYHRPAHLWGAKRGKRTKD